MRFNIMRTIGMKTTLILGLLVMVFSCILGMVSYFNSSEILYRNIYESFMDRARDNSKLVSQVFQSRLRELEIIASGPEIQAMDWEKQMKEFKTRLTEFGVKRFQVIDKKGILRSSNGYILDVSDREYFRKAISGTANMSDVFISRMDNSMVIVCAAPIKDESGDILGVLTSTLDYQLLNDIISNIKIGNGGYAFIVNKQGATIAHPDKEMILSSETELVQTEKPENNKHLEELIKRMTNGETGVGFYKYDGTEKLLAYVPVPDTSWFLALTIPEKEIFSQLEWLKYKFIVITSIFVISSLLLIYFIIIYLSERQKVEELKRNADQSYKRLMEVTEMDKLKTEFFANISHEFRTPINVILGALQLFEFYINNEMPINTEGADRKIKVMKQNCLRLLRLVNNLIDTTRISSGYLEVNLQNDNIVSVVEKITMSVVDYVNEKGIELIFDTEVEEKIMAFDHDKIEKVMLNLLSNATKFTSRGGSITVSVYDSGDTVAVSVKDTGIGIPEDQQEAIFERFKQVDNSMTRRHEGSGIGLSLVKSFVNMHGGRIYVKSEYGKGSEFIFELPVKILQDGEFKTKDADLEEDYHSHVEKINVEFSDIYM